MASPVGCYETALMCFWWYTEDIRLNSKCQSAGIEGLDQCWSASKLTSTRSSVLLPALGSIGAGGTVGDSMCVGMSAHACL